MNKEAKDSLPTVEHMREDLKARCAEIPTYGWRHIYPDFQISIGSPRYQSNLLPGGVPMGSHEVNGKGEKLETPNVVGNDAIETFLSRNGRFFQKLVHYKGDYQDKVEKYAPDEILAELKDEDYPDAYLEAVGKLEMLREVFNKLYPEEQIASAIPTLSTRPEYPQ